MAIEIIKNAAFLTKKTTYSPRTEQGKTLLKLKIGEGFRTKMNKSQGIRASAAKSGLKISINDLGGGNCIVVRRA